MDIDWQNFTPWSALLGGALLGVSATILAIGIGRIAGVSGIVGNLLSRSPRQEYAWRLAFIVGLILSPTLYGLFASFPASQVEMAPQTLVVAGLLVGFGTRLGSGCTSGHGVCGLSRLSPRSLAATLAFMSAGIATVFITRHLIA